MESFQSCKKVHIQVLILCGRFVEWQGRLDPQSLFFAVRVVASMLELVRRLRTFDARVLGVLKWENEVRVEVIDQTQCR